MSRRLLYIPGNTYGPFNLLLLSRSDRADKYGKHKWGFYKCPDCGESFEANNQSVRIGDTQRCPSCRKKWRQAVSCFNELNKKYYPGMRVGPKNILFIQECGHLGKDRSGIFQCPVCLRMDWITRLSDVCSGASTKCKDCATKESIDRCIDYGRQSGYNLLGRRFGKLLVVESVYREHKDKNGLLWCCRCDCGKICEVHSRDLVSGRIMSCGCDASHSKGENRIKNILDGNIIFYQEYSFSNCINPKTNKNLRFDFYLPDYDCCIEYDGKQHFQEVQLFETSLQENQYRDSIKDQYCKDNNIGLIRIPYWDYNRIDKDYLEQLLQSHRGGEVDELQRFSEPNQQSC